MVRVFIKRCHEVDPYLNAIVDECFEDALRKAKEVDLKVERELSGWKFEDEKSIHEYPFLGVPFTAKNSIGVKGKTQSVGLVVRKEVKADHDCVVVERMERDGGAIFLALTNVPELLLFVHSFNHLNGQTNNPYDMSRTSGGSSGGEGALIGAAASVIGVSFGSSDLELTFAFRLDRTWVVQFGFPLTTVVSMATRPRPHWFPLMGHIRSPLRPRKNAPL